MIIWVLALSLGSVWDAAEDSALEFPVMLPELIPEALVVLPVGAGGPPERLAKKVPGEMSFYTIPEETEPLRARLAEASSGDDAPVPVFDPAAGTSIWKLGAIWRVLKDTGSPPVLLALPGPEDAESRILLRAR